MSNKYFIAESEVLEGVIDLLSDPERWNKGCYAKTSEGIQVTGNNPDAVTFCAVGAVQRVIGDRWITFYETVTRLNNLSNGRTITVYNDDLQTTHEDIILLLKNALYQAREERP